MKIVKTLKIDMKITELRMQVMYFMVLEQADSIYTYKTQLLNCRLEQINEIQKNQSKK